MLLVCESKSVKLRKVEGVNVREGDFWVLSLNPEITLFTVIFDAIFIPPSKFQVQIRQNYFDSGMFDDLGFLSRRPRNPVYT